MRVSIVIPVLNEAARIVRCLERVLEQAGPGIELEVIVVDGGSTDGTVERARDAEAKRSSGAVVRAVVAPRRGRARQLNFGAREASGEVVLFLHVDTELPPRALQRVVAAREAGADYGWFTVRIDSRDPRLRVASRLWSARSRRFVSSTGDQAQFFGRDFFFRLGGYPPLDLCEDLAILRFARRASRRHACIDAPVLTSARRWEANGINRTILTMFKIRAMFHLGVPHQRLAAQWRALARG